MILFREELENGKFLGRHFDDVLSVPKTFKSYKNDVICDFLKFFCVIIYF